MQLGGAVIPADYHRPPHTTTDLTTDYHPKQAKFVRKQKTYKMKIQADNQF